MEPADIGEYPDSDKVGIFVGPQGNCDLRLMFKARQSVDYWDGEFY